MQGSSPRSPETAKRRPLKMAPKEQYSYEYFNVTFPAEYVAQVEVNRPQKLNAWIEVMWVGFSQLINRLSHDADVRAIVVTAAGDRAFTAGLDVQAASQGEALGLTQAAELDPARKAAYTRRHILEFQACITALEQCEKPVIMLYHGISYGLAVDLGVASDIRIATQDVALCVKEVDIGLAADIGTLTRLPKVVGNFGWIKEVALSARIFGADEALRVGFVSHVAATKTEGLQKALEIAKLIATKSPIAVFGTKEILNWSRDRSVEDGKSCSRRSRSFWSLT